MSLMHSLLAGYLRFAGRHAAANEVEAAAASAGRSRPALPTVEEMLPSPPLESAPAALVIHGDERDVQGGHAPAAAVTNSSAGGSVGAEAGNAPTVSSYAASADAGGFITSAGTVSGFGSEAVAAAGDENEAKLEPAEPPHQQPSLRDDPLHGIYSERMRQRIESDAFRSASSTAQDTVIAATADRLLPPELRRVLSCDVPYVDISPVAREARIEALGGEIPRWARGDAENDPAIIRALAAARGSKTASVSAFNSTSDLAASREANGVRAREHVDALATASPAAIAQRAVQEPAQLPEQLPAQPSRAAAAGRGLER